MRARASGNGAERPAAQTDHDDPNAPSQAKDGCGAAAGGRFSDFAHIDIGPVDAVLDERGGNPMQTPREVRLTVAPSSMRVREARDQYLAENGFSLDEYDKKYAWFIVFGVRIAVPNSEGRRRALPFHDLHHVALGFGTDPAGEFEVTAWERRTGFDGLGAWVSFLVFMGLLGGLFLSPRRTIAAWRAARGHRSLYRAPLPYEHLLAMTVGELRAHLGVPAAGLASAPKPHDRAPIRLSPGAVAA
jgi:hypothetical protein